MIDDEMVLAGASEATRLIERDIALAARCDLPVLIGGERGVGKHLVARLIHARSRRATAPLLRMPAEPFPAGVERAQDGTLVLEGVCAMNAAGQHALMRFLQFGESAEPPVAATASSLNIRVIALTRRNLMAQGFSEALYYRLNVIHVVVQSLRDRIEDLPLLLSRFLADAACARGVGTPDVSAEALAAMMAYRWPGNVRELKDLVEGLVQRAPQQRIELDALPLDHWRPHP
jgi:two-component system nitrogen regulation response regulator NtrX